MTKSSESGTVEKGCHVSTRNRRRVEPSSDLRTRDPSQGPTRLSSLSTPVIVT